MVLVQVPFLYHVVLVQVSCKYGDGADVVMVWCCLCSGVSVVHVLCQCGSGAVPMQVQFTFYFYLWVFQKMSVLVGFQSTVFELQ